MSRNKRFALLGAAGYIAPRHLQAMQAHQGQLSYAHDPSDSVGILDRFFPDASYFPRSESFFSRLMEDKSAGRPIDLVAICSPNDLHADHAILCLEAGCDVLCEKPLALTQSELDRMNAAQKRTGKRIYPVLQLRLHHEIERLRSDLRAATGEKRHQVELTYITSRGDWYMQSWKAQAARSGGITMNIGIHFFDMLIWLFGSPESFDVSEWAERSAAGTIKLENADVSWRMSLNRSDLPPACIAAGKTTFRQITIDDKELEFSGGFEKLHEAVYASALNGTGFTLADAAPALMLLENMRQQQT